MPENNLKAINTFYKGYWFRSRLEARWAIYFDTLGIKWEYEFEGFDLNGVKYLPDFWLPEMQGGMYVEVKPVELNEDEINKASLLCELSAKDVWLAVGVPEAKEYWVMVERGEMQSRLLPHYDDDNKITEMKCCRHFDVDDEGYLLDYKALSGYMVPKEEMYPHIFKAVNAAKSARFEHGEKN